MEIQILILSLKINIYSNATNAKRTPVATVTAAEAAAQEDGEIIINEAGGGPGGQAENAVATGSGGGTGDVGQPAAAGAVQELAETPKPPGKTAGKKAKDKSELHSHIFDHLEKEVPEEDPLELQFISMAKCAKLELPGKQAFSAALKLVSVLDDYIEEYERKQIVANTQYDNGFLNTGANQVNVNAVPAQVHTLQLLKPPPILQAQPLAMMQQQGQQGDILYNSHRVHKPSCSNRHLHFSPHLFHRQMIWYWTKF